MPSGDEKWVERIVAAVVVAILSTAIANFWGQLSAIQSNEIHAAEWRGQMTERVNNAVATVERLEKLEEARLAAPGRIP